jgi:hypothetical protein
MKRMERDLLVLSKNAVSNSVAFEHEVNVLLNILFKVETTQQFCTANEVIDVNRNRIITKPLLVERAVYERKDKSFVFINCKN